MSSKIFAVIPPLIIGAAQTLDDKKRTKKTTLKITIIFIFLSKNVHNKSIKTKSPF